MRKILYLFALTTISICYCENVSAECQEGEVLGVSTKTCIPAGGSCGENCSYTIDESGNLNVFPTDSSKTATYNSRGAATELYMSKNIVNVNIEEGIVGLAYDSFAICNNIESMNLPNSLETIGGCTFQFEGKLNAVIIPPNVKNFSSTARNAKIAYYCAENTIDQCGNSAVKYKLTDDGVYFIYDKDDNVKGLYTDLDSILNDTPVESYSIADKNGNLLTKYDGRGNEVERYTYDSGGNLFSAYQNGKSVYKRKIYTIEEAEAATKKGNVNRFTITW